jgi:hypothetical protein
LTQQLLARLSEGGELARFLAVIGPSGSGKSSVVKAGLVPALRRGGLLGSENWFYVDLLPGPHPFEELEAALLRVAVNPPASLLEQLKSDARGLLRAVNRILPADENVELVLVIDQFEELFTLLADERERELFINNLVAAVLDERSRLRVVITLRADFVDRPLRYWIWVSSYNGATNWSCLSPPTSWNAPSLARLGVWASASKAAWPR